jgi:hypothetical protein
MVTNRENVRKSLFWKDEIKVLLFNSSFPDPGYNISLVNVGDGEVWVSHAFVELHEPKATGIIPIAKTLKETSALDHRIPDYLDEKVR